MNKLNRSQGCLMGLAVGDAVGTTLEFKQRDSENITDMVGGGPFQLEVGQWTDDTSMALCLGYALLEDHKVETSDWSRLQLVNYVDWYKNGYCSSNGYCFDIGGTTRNALLNFIRNGTLVNNDHFLDSGNGSLMRLAPIPIYYNTGADVDKFTYLCYAADMSSSTTHASTLCRQSCVAFAVLLNRALNGPIELENVEHDVLQSKRSLLSFPEKVWEGLVCEPLVLEIMNGSYKNKSRDEISSSGYVIDSLEAALWCFWNTENFSDAILLAANLGDDADTVAAITGQIAGAFYGLDGIPDEWVQKISKKDEILQLAEDLTDGN
ncbi:ADP-ribosylglycohydrolase family protein [Salmonella enterica]|uniref:ADP-ribosylglycohydrolase family protein n=1 Tax=Salmonella enterica TaxID=28901 RepID=UPI003A7FABD8